MGYMFSFKLLHNVTLHYLKIYTNGKNLHPLETIWTQIMKTTIKAIFIVILCSYSAFAQTTIKINTLEQLYKNGQYEKAISQFGHLGSSENSDTLFILGECYFENATRKERKAMDEYQQALYKERMMSLQGVYIYNSLARTLYSIDINEVMEMRTKALKLYSKSSALGNVNAVNKLNFINSVYGYGNSPFPSGIAPAVNPNSEYQAPAKQKCSYCNGTGRIDGYVAAYGNIDQKWCSECGKNVSAGHCHGCNTCPSCGGDGYR